MDQKVLVLNGDYTAITLCSVQKAFVLLFLDKAEMVAKSEHGTLRTISHAYPKPSIIRLQRYVRVPYKGIALSRHNIFKRDHFECQYCGSPKNLTLDHVLPRQVFRPVRAILEQPPVAATVPAAEADPFAAWITAAWNSEDPWLRACAVRASRHSPGFDVQGFAGAKDLDPRVLAELAACAASQAVAC